MSLSKILNPYLAMSILFSGLYMPCDLVSMHPHEKRRIDCFEKNIQRLSTEHSMECSLLNNETPEAE
jgi:hypothetical protein